MIICGDQPGEIYFNSLYDEHVGFPGLYYSTDSGRNITLIDTTTDPYCDMYGGLLKDASIGFLYRMSEWPEGGIYLSMDCGRNWAYQDTNYQPFGYASGVLSGEIYRIRYFPWPNDSNYVERSIAYGQGFSGCPTLGFDHSIPIYDLALGADSGSVFFSTYFGDLFYSSNYADSFTHLVNFQQTWGISPYSELLNGARGDEIYIYPYDAGARRIFRIFNSGASEQLIADFTYYGIGWYCEAATSRRPGEVYYLAIQPNGGLGGPVRIHHTTDYGQHWTIYEHIMGPNGVEDHSNHILPNIPTLLVYPNPANASFNITYQLPKAQSVSFGLFNTLGQQVWKSESGFQLPGSHALNFENACLPSGQYILQLSTGSSREIRRITIVR
jgi:hypothetical protein